MTNPNENQGYCKGLLKLLFLMLLSSAAFAQPANDLCSNATTLVSYPGSSCSFPTAGTLTGATYTAGSGLTGCSGSTSVDVWYSFVAKSPNPTIRVSQTSGSAGLRRIQLFTGTCTAFSTSVCGANNDNYNATGLTVGQTYYIRVFSTGAAFNFNICVTDPNDLCGSAVTLTSSSSCTTVPGNVYASTTSTTTISSPNCAPSATYDVWYRFVAQTTNPTISLTNIGAGFTNPSLQLLSNNCGGTFTPLYCGSTSINANHLTPGTTYLVRVYSTGASPSSPANAGFDICVTDPVSPPPSNDECINAVNLSTASGCNSIPGDMAGATPSSQPLGGSCTGPNAYDVWYKFTAVNNTASISLGSIGANFLTPRIELLSGSCGSLVSVACGTNPLTNSSLTPGNTYYIRVYSTTAPPPNGNARFTICITSSALPTVRFGNSYVNVSKRSTGGVVEPGDTLEIRMTIHHTAGTVSNLRFVDNIPTNTALLTGPTDYIRVITNEGLTYKQYTTAAGDDAATYLASPPPGEFNIRMNLGFGGTNPGIPTNNTASEAASATGTMTNSNNPRGGGGLLFAVAYRVVVTGSVGATIQLNPAQFVYRTGGTDITLTATPYNLLVTQPLTLCSNSIGLNNANEFGGTFGSGTTLNRPTDLTNPIPGYSFLNNINAFNGLGDGRYAIVKNMSPRSGTSRTANHVPSCGSLAFDDQQNCNNRMHSGHWHIDGDHTGTNNATGNLPPSASASAGYMLMVNADFVASEVYSQTLTNLCPNTYYEFSAWFRNICHTCGADSLGQQFAGTPTAPASGYPGVLPNLSFALDGLDYYSTGEIGVNGWQKKGFVFRTGPTQTSATFSIRNNSQGGGGNDWVMDDIAVATCLPTMSYSPTINPFVCEGNPIVIADTISSYFRNYTTFKWQRSTNGGTTWTDITGVTSLPDTNYYVTSYTVPPAHTTLANNGDLYRVVVATNAANLSNPNCNISDGVTITLQVDSCGPVLDVKILSFSGRLTNSGAQLSWSTSPETVPVHFIVERSADGRNFSTAGTVAGSNNNNANRYAYTDSRMFTGTTWYRVVLVTQAGVKKYSAAIQLHNSNTDFELTNLVNPFRHTLNFNLQMPASATVQVELLDVTGKTLVFADRYAYNGTNSISLDTNTLPAGVYTLRVISQDKFLVKRVIKTQ